MTETPPTPPPDQLPELPHYSCTTNSASSLPVRKIYTQVDLTSWTESEAYHYIEAFIIRLSVAVEGKKVDESCQENSAIGSIVEYLDQAQSWIDHIPLQTGPQRFGNRAFRDWMTKLEQSNDAFQSALLTPEQACVLPELSHHFMTAFGSAARLDYGTGHELSFLAYLLILRLIGAFGPEHEQALVTRVFVAYLDLVRRLQKVFKLEPAGSKGVWGLDDHQHLSYLFGASQLRTHPSVRPSSVLSPPSISPYGVSYLFLSSILHVNDLKKGAPFAEHSPMLHNIASTVPTWSKVASGLLKMYRAEVLHKVPVVQHFYFGDVLAWRRYEAASPFQGDVLPSTADHMDEQERALLDETDDAARRERDEGTVAPWALPSLSGTGNGTGTSAAPVGRMQQGNSPGRLEPRPFQPPTLFANRRRPSSPLATATTVASVGTEERRDHQWNGDLDQKPRERETVASQGGAAAASSPFGVLNKASLS